MNINFEQFCIVSDDIQKNDIVIFQVPFIERYRIPSHENNWYNISSDYDGKLQPKLFSEMSIQYNELIICTNKKF